MRAWLQPGSLPLSHLILLPSHLQAVLSMKTPQDYTKLSEYPHMASEWKVQWVLLITSQPWR